MVEGVDCVEIARRYSTPTFVFSENQIRKNYQIILRLLKERYSDSQIFYAIKANPNIALLKILNSEGCGAECVSFGEMKCALEAGIKPQQLVINGSNKGDKELELAISEGMVINVDNIDELERIKSLAVQLNKKVGLRLRLSISYLLTSADITVHEQIDKEFYLDKWGMDGQEFIKALDLIEREPFLEYLGISFHLGLPDSTKPYKSAIEKALSLNAGTFGAHRTKDIDLDIGGGFRYGTNPEGGGNENIPSPEDYIIEISSTITNCCKRLNINKPRLILELGRYLTGNAGLLLTTVGLVKHRPDQETPMVNIDASFTQMMMSVIIGSKYPIIHVTKPLYKKNDQVIVNITGQTCSPDIIAYHESIPGIEQGDLLAILDIGAYSEVLSSSFNSIPRPATVLVTNGSVCLITRREEISDLLSRYIIPSHL